MPRGKTKEKAGEKENEVRHSWTEDGPACHQQREQQSVDGFFFFTPAYLNLLFN